VRRVCSTALAATGFTLVSLLSPTVAAGPAFVLLLAATFVIVRPALVEG
jgi:hypothetical protein